MCFMDVIVILLWVLERHVDGIVAAMELLSYTAILQILIHDMLAVRKRWNMRDALSTL